MVDPVNVFIPPLHGAWAGVHCPAPQVLGSLCSFAWGPSPVPDGLSSLGTGEPGSSWIWCLQEQPLINEGQELLDEPSSFPTLQPHSGNFFLIVNLFILFLFYLV